MPLSNRFGLAHGKKNILQNTSGSNVSSLTLDGNTLQLNQTNNVPTRSVDLSSIGGGGGTPGGSTTQLQYNNGGAFAGAAAMTYDSTDEKLVLTSSVANKYPLKLKNSNNSSVVNGLLIADDADGSRLAITHSNVDNENNIWGYENIPMKFATNDTERMRILGGGNVGIGTTNPNESLHVQGNAIVDGHIYMAGTLQHYGDTDTYIGFTGNDTIEIQTGGASRISVNDSGVLLGNANARVTTILDEDNMASNSATALATQQSIKAYVDASSGGGIGGSIANTQIAYGNGTDIAGSASLTYTSAGGISLLQGADEAGVVISGYDDKSSDWLKLHVKSDGNARVRAAVNLQNQAAESIYLSAGEHLYLDNGTRNTYSTIFRDGTGEYARFKNARLGIGSTNPSYPLHVVQNSGDTYGMYLFNNGSKGIYFGDTNNNGTGFGKIGGVGGSLFLGSTQVYTSFIPTSDSSANLGQSNRRWSYSFFRYGQFGYSSGDDENSGSGGYVLGVSGNANRHPFMVKAYGDEGVPSLIVTSGSNVGIGIASPGQKLDVDGNLRVRDSHTLAAGDSDDVYLYHDGNSTLRSNTGSFNIVQNTSDNLNITANGGDIVIDSNIYNLNNGKVGIGGSPSYNLDVIDNGADANYVAVSNTSAGTSSIAGFRLQSQTTDGLIIGHADNRTVSRYGITLGGYTEILTTAGNGLVIGNSHNAPIVFGTNNAEQLRIADNLITLGDGVVLAPHSSDDFTIDSPNDIVLDADGGDVLLKDGSDGTFGKLTHNNTYWDFNGNTGDSYLRFIPWNGGAGTTAYTYWGDGTHNQIIYVRGTDSINTNSTTIANTFIQQYDGAGNSDTFIQAGGDSYILNQLGLGTNSPSEQLQLKGDSTYLSILAADGSEGVRLGTASSGKGLFYLRDAGGNNKIYLEAGGTSYINGGNVGIGTTNPNAKLEVLSTSNPQIRANYNGSHYLDIYASSGIGYIKQDGRFRVSSSTARYFFGGNATSTGRAELFVSAGGDIANKRISSFAYLLRGYQGADGAGIYFGNAVSGSNNEGNTSASGREGTQWYAGLNYAGGGATDEWILGTDYRTTSGSGADGYTPVITAQKSGAYGPEGKIGINTVNPAATFDIRQRPSNHGLIVDTDYSNGDQIRVLKDGNTNLLGKVTFDGTNMVVGAWGTGGGIRFWNQTEGMRLTGGKLGIGTTAPWQQLHLTGDMLVEGSNIYFGTSDKVKLKRGGTNYFEMLTSGNSAAGLRSLGLLVSNTYGSTPQRGTVTFQGLAVANKPTAASGYGFLWVSGTSAEKLYFTEGDGTQHDLTAGGGGSSVSFGSDNQIPFTNSGGDDFDYSANLTFDGSTLIADADIQIKDGEKLLIGDTSEFQLYGNGGSTKYLTALDKQLLIWSQGSSASPIKIQATDTSGGIQFNIAGTEMGRFTSTGLGIGTTNPNYKLDVYGDVNVTGSLRFNDGDNTRIFSSSENLYIRAHNDMYFNIDTPNDDDTRHFIFRANTSSEIMRLGEDKIAEFKGAVGIGLANPSVTRQSEGLTISGTSITSTAYTSSTHKKVTSLFVPSLGSGSYILAGIGGRNSQMGDGRAEPPIMVIGDVGTSLHQTTMNSGRAVSLVLAGTAGYNSGGQDFGNFGSLLFHGNSNWSGNSRRWLVTNAWRRSGAGDMGLGFASETSAGLDPTVSGSTPSVVMSNDANYGVAGKGGLLVGNTSHINSGKLTIVDADNNKQLTLAHDGSNYTTFKVPSNGGLTIDAANDINLDSYTGITNYHYRGNEKFRITAGASSPVTLQPKASNYDLALNAQDGTEVLRLDSTNKRIGIGTNAPATTFHVSGTNITSRFQDTTGVAFTDIKRIAVENTYAAVVAGNAGQALGTTDDAYTDIWTNKSRHIAFRHATGSTTDGATTYMSGSRASSEYLQFKTTGNNYSKGGIISAPNELYIITQAKDMNFNSANNLTTHYDKEYVIYNDTGNPVFHIRSGSTAAIEFEGDGDMRFKQAGTSTKMSLLANGNFGIGTTSPDVALDVRGSGWPMAALHASSQYGTGLQLYNSHTTQQDWAIIGGGATYNYAFRVYDQTDATYRFAIDRDGKVGIGGTNAGIVTPTAKLEVTSPTNSYEQARFQWDTSNYLGVYVDSAGNSQLEAKTGNLTLKTDTSAHDVRVDAKGNFRVDLGDSNGGYYTRIRAADSSPVLMAKSNGLIGIGTESPDDLLHVLGGDVDPSIKLQNNRSGHNGYYLMEHRGSTLKLQSTGSAVVPIRFTIQNSDIMRIDDTGLGIGTDAPSSSLHVSGGAIQKDIGESIYLRSIHAGFDTNAILQHQPNTQYVKAEATSPPGTGAIPTELPLAEAKYTGLEITVMQRWDADPEGALTVQKQAGSSDVIYEGGSNSASATVSIAAYRGANKTFVIAAAGVWVVKD